MRFNNIVVIPALFAATAIAQDAPPAGETAAPPAGCLGTGGIMGILPIVAMVAIFYFLIIRPQQKQAKKLQEMREAMKKGDKVVTGGGIYGIITNLKDSVVTIRIADSVKVDVDRNALTVVEGEQNTKNE